MTVLHENAIKLGLLESCNWMLYKGGHSPEKANGELDLVETNTIYFVLDHNIWIFAMFYWLNGISEIFLKFSDQHLRKNQIYLSLIFEEIAKFWPKFYYGWLWEFLALNF